MLYVMSDIHGCYSEFVRMLEKISFTNEDELYILGDIIDRGSEPIRLLQKIMNASNIKVLLGNHELMAIKNFSYGIGVPIDERGFYLPPEAKRFYSVWMHSGGETTLKQFKALPIETGLGIKRWLQKLPLYHEVSVDNKKFVMVHAGIENFTQNRELSDYKPNELVWYPPETLEIPMFKDENTFLVFGHTPTFRLSDGCVGKIFMKNRYIGVDCGASYQEFGGRLGSLCLDTMEEFYV